jgi:hypothetical protein
MEIGQVGNHWLSACRYCDELFDWVPETDTKVHGITALDKLYRQHLAVRPACKAQADAQPTLGEAMAELQEAYRAGEQERQEHQKSRDARPDNNRAGYWRVIGIRHEATTKASGAREAITKCVAADAVGSWESPEAVFLGEDLPDVF